MHDIAEELVPLYGADDICPTDLIEFAVDFTLTVLEVVRTKPAPTAIKDLQKEVEKWRQDFRERIGAARKEAA